MAYPHYPPADLPPTPTPQNPVYPPPFAPPATQPTNYHYWTAQEQPTPSTYAYANVYPPPPPQPQDQPATAYPPPQPQAQPAAAHPPPGAVTGDAHARVPQVPVERPRQAVIAKPIPVVGPQYCLPRPVDLMIVRKLMTLTDDFMVTDVDNNMIFKVKGKLLSLHDKRVLLDAAGTPVLTLSRKIMTAHRRWQVFRGGSTYPGDLLFSARTSSMIQLKTKLNVYLGNRASEDVCDFKVEGSWSERSCVVYVGESTIVAAQMYKKDSAKSFFLGKDTFMVTVNPNVDYAFVVALILILDAVNTADDA